MSPRETEVRRLAERLAGGRSFACSRVLPSDDLTPVALFRRLRTAGEECVLLESVEGGEHLARYTFLGTRPSARFLLKGGEAFLETAGERRRRLDGEPLAALEKLVVREGFERDAELPPLCSGAVGFLSYDAVRLFEEIPDRHAKEDSLPDALFLIFDAVVAFDHARQRLLFLTSAGPAEKGRETEEAAAAAGRLDALEKIVSTAAGTGEVLRARALREPPGVGIPPSFTPLLAREDFLEAVSLAKEQILSGEVYQIVLSQRWSARLPIDPFEVYRALRMLNPSPYMFFLETREASVLGASPEMLVRCRGRRVETRPIAGTSPRGASPEEDARLAAGLLEDPKERAEHVMLVDLARNDLGRVCAIGSVRVTRFAGVEKYSHVQHLVSEVEGVLSPGRRSVDALAACFPAGTLTGAPKIRAMELIDAFERARRGVYGGAVGYLDAAGDLDMAIAIRTAVAESGRWRVQAGAGIVADSVPEKEYAEAEQKAAALFRAIELARSWSGGAGAP